MPPETLTTENLLTIAALFPKGINSLSNLSNTWNDKSSTKELMVRFNGSGNMFGGSGRFVHILIHGRYSAAQPHGTMEFVGHGFYSYNIARGANGPTASGARYYKSKTVPSYDNYDQTPPTYTIDVQGSCGADSAMLAVLNLDIDFLKK